MNRRVAYVVKRYPRFSETFIVNEILAHEAAGLSIDLFSLRPPVDTHFQISYRGPCAADLSLRWAGQGV